ncbi:MAG: hypothetical protein KBA02_05255 [Paludibacteraceae bacterium]|nr:hypothetical protein [Paludibacteraceae bacterium]
MGLQYIFKKKCNDFVLIIEERPNFVLTLTTLMELLKSSGNNAQSDLIYKLIDLLNQNNLSDFVKQINGVDMWGGSGAVWEVYIEDKKVATEFEKEIITLIRLMEKTEIIGKGIKPIKKFFEKNLKQDKV